MITEKSALIHQEMEAAVVNIDGKTVSTCLLESRMVKAHKRHDNFPKLVKLKDTDHGLLKDSSATAVTLAEESLEKIEPGVLR